VLYAASVVLKPLGGTGAPVGGSISSIDVRENLVKATRDRVGSPTISPWS